jgi:hypothetical protein
MTSPSHLRRTAAVLACCATLAVRPAAAQTQGNGFLFVQPAASLALRGGYALAAAGSDIFTFATDELTLGKRDFSGFTGDADLAIRAASRVDVVLSAGLSSASKRSEMRHWVDMDDKPIEQSTYFTRVPMTVGGRYYLTPRGRSVGRFAWVPSRYAPFVGAGVGTMWYRFRQEGDFVDVDSPNKDVFTDELKTQGFAAMAYGAAGVDLSLNPRFAFSTQAKYSLARGPVGGDFQGFDRIDLSGFAVTAGFAVRF